MRPFGMEMLTGSGPVSGAATKWAEPPGLSVGHLRFGIGVRLGWRLRDDYATLGRILELVATSDAVRSEAQNAELTELLRQRVEQFYGADPSSGYATHLAAAGMVLLKRTVVRYHGDFDWHGIAIARRIFERGARPWRFGRDDYVGSVDRLPAENRLGLSGRAEATPWDQGLRAAMAAADVAVHEEAIVDLLLADLR